MKRLLACVAVLGMASPVLAGELRDTQLMLGVTPQGLLHEGAPRVFALSEAAGPRELRLNLAASPNLAAGPLLSWSRAAAVATPGGGDPQGNLRVGSFIEYALDELHFDGALRGAAGRDGVAGTVGAAYASHVPATGTAYRVRVGSEWADSEYGDSYFSVNPALSGFGMTESDAIGGYRDINVALSFTHPITPNLYVAGTAGAKRVIGDGGDGANGAEANRFHLGAGLGLRF